MYKGNPGIGPITRATPSEFAKFTAIANRVTITTIGGLPKWPFKDMEVGDRVLIEPKLAARARAMVLAAKHRTKKRFEVLAHPHGLEVFRIPDAPSKTPPSNG